MISRHFAGHDVICDRALDPMNQSSADKVFSRQLFFSCEYDRRAAADRFRSKIDRATNCTLGSTCRKSESSQLPSGIRKNKPSPIFSRVSEIKLVVRNLAHCA